MNIRKAGLTLLAMTSVCVSSLAASAEDYRVCPFKQTEIGIETVKEKCGDISRPEFEVEGQTTLEDIKTMQAKRDAFQAEVKAYGQCVTSFINSYRRPGADASSTAPDEAACAHAWAEDQVTESIREFGRTCFAFNDTALMKGEPGFEGSCYPDFGDAG